MSTKGRPIVIVRRKGGHGSHLGGAWKVAYADFVTAMMSLFIVLWLMGSSEKVKSAVAGYFNDPRGTGSLVNTAMTDAGETASALDGGSMQKLKGKLEAEIKAKKELETLAKQIEITVTPEGLRVELIEGKNGTFYQSGSARLSSTGQELLALLAGELKTLPNPLLIEGHTDSTPYSAGNEYSNWELSADRANSARRLMQQDGVRSDQVTQVRGYADQLLRVRNNPADPSNRRISILVKNRNAPISEMAQSTLGNPPSTMRAGVAQAAPGGSKVAEGAASGAQTNPSPDTAAAQPGLMDRLKGMLPGSKTASPSK